MILRKIFKIPSPKELGLSKTDALPLRKITPEVTGVTWEDYYEIIKEKYPVRYFFAETLANYLKFKIWYKVKYPLIRIYEYLLYNFHPNYKYHLLDLRQPGKDRYAVDYYRYGWIELDSKIMFAAMNLLKSYFDNKPYDVSLDYSLEEIQNDIGLKNQHETYEEAKRILQWWIKERKDLLKNKDELLNEWYDLRNVNLTASKILKEKMDELDELIKIQEEDMLIRLIKIRKNLWI